MTGNNDGLTCMGCPGRKFSMLQTVMQLSKRSRTTTVFHLLPSPSKRFLSTSTCGEKEKGFLLHQHIPAFLHCRRSPNPVRQARVAWSMTGYPAPAARRHPPHSTARSDGLQYQSHSLRSQRFPTVLRVNDGLARECRETAQSYFRKSCLIEGTP